MTHYQIRCHRRGRCPFVWDVIAANPRQAIRLAIFTWPNHFFTLIDRDFPSFLA